MKLKLIPLKNLESSAAAEIGKLYKKGLESFKEVGRRLQEQKDSMARGDWIPWLKGNQKTLGFGTRTAERLMKCFECDASDEFDLWGHDRPEVEIKPQPELPDNVFRVLYADPPWSYGDQLVSGYGAATHHYQTMTIAELCALEINKLAYTDSVLFLWVTSPLLSEAFAVIEAWGFEYKSSFIWDKVKHNFGHYNSVRHELLLICTRGSCLPDNDELHDSVISIERGEHSEKPPYFRELIDKMYPPSGKDRIELFARGELPEHWTGWGNESRVSTIL